MTRRQAGIVSAVAFAALIRPVSNLLEFADLVWNVISQGGIPPRIRLSMAIAGVCGMAAAQWANILIGWLAAAVPALLIYRYLRRRDFAQVCADCAAHRICAWSLLLAFFALTLLRPGMVVEAIGVPIPFEQVEIPLDEATGQNPMATLELCLCHPENDRLEGELKSIGRLTDDVLANAPKIDGYRLMRSKECDDAVYYVSEKAELTHDDIVSAKVMKPFGEDDWYEVSVKLTPEGRGRLARLTRDHQPHGAKNNSDRGRALAIVVNGELVAAPIIQAEINTGEAVIMGNFTKEEAVNLAVALNTRRNEEE